MCEIVREKIMRLRSIAPASASLRVASAPDLIVLAPTRARSIHLSWSIIRCRNYDVQRPQQSARACDPMHGTALPRTFALTG